MCSNVHREIVFPRITRRDEISESGGAGPDGAGVLVAEVVRLLVNLHVKPHVSLLNLESLSSEFGNETFGIL